MNIRWFETLSIRDVPQVGGKNASLGEMIRTLKSKKIAIPNGFALTASAYRRFLKENDLKKVIAKELEYLKKHPQKLAKVGKSIRSHFLKGHFSKEVKSEIVESYQKLSKLYKMKECDVAVRSSATAEDLPTASFAGQQETFLNVRGEKAVLKACLHCYASLFTDRAISYRETKKFDHLEIALSIGIQKMVRADIGSSGVMFTLDPETGFRNVVVINAAWGLGENVVQGAISPDEFVVFKPLGTILEKTLGKKEKKLVYASHLRSTKNIKTTQKEQKAFSLSDKDILLLTKWGILIEKHYRIPMDVEWVKDGKTGKLFIVQARPETVQSQKKEGIFKSYSLKGKGKKLCEGLAIGDAVVAGKVQVIKSTKEINRFKDGSILVTKMTSPDWVPIMERASGIITDLGGRTSHAAIVSRELGLPAIVGTGDATRVLKDDEEITLSCAEGSKGFIYQGKIPFEEKEIGIKKIPRLKTKIMMNIASPEAAFRFWPIPCEGIGLARMEFIINNIIQIHPMALIHFDKVKGKKERKKIEELTRNYANKKEYFIDHLSRGIAKIAASRYPYPVIVRMSDFKTNEYAGLIGGKPFEPKEENPMLGWRGASRYYNPKYREGFALECEAIKRAREMGFKNILIMIPFCRTLEEADKVLKELKKNGLMRKKQGLQIYVMCEIPSNIILAKGFAKRFDGFSIGSNDLTQLLLGIDRDSQELAPLFDERNEAVKKEIKELIQIAHREKRKVGICGQAPSDYPDFANFLIQLGIDSMSLNPDSIIPTINRLS